MSRKQLAQSVEFLQNFSDHAHEGVHAWRKCLVILVQNFLTGQKSTSAEKTAGMVECLMPFQFCQHCVENNAEVFVYPTWVNKDDTPGLSQMNKQDVQDGEKETQAFTLWFLSHMMNLLGHKNCSGLHAKCLETVQSVLTAVKARDLYQYTCLLKEFFFCVADLTQVNEAMYSERGSGPITLKRFQVPEALVINSLQDPEKKDEDLELQLTSTTLEVTDAEMCELLQLQFTKILHSETSNMALLYDEGEGQQLPVLWACLCCHLEHGNLDLKVESLEMISDLLENGMFPVYAVMPYFTDCIVALLELLCTGCRNIEYSSRQKLETSFGRTLKEMMTCDISRITKLFSVEQLNKFMLKMASVLSAVGLSKLSTNELKVSVCEAFCQIDSSLLKSALNDAGDQSQQSFISTLVQEIGHQGELQYLVNLLVESVICELSGSGATEDATSSSQEDVEMEDQEGKKSKSTFMQNRKRKAEDETVRRNGTNKSSLQKLLKSITYKVLMAKLEELLQQEITEEEVCEIVEGLRVVVEVVVACVSMYCSRGDLSLASGQVDLRTQLHTWLPVKQCESICTLWIRFLQLAADMDNTKLNKATSAIVKAIGALMTVREGVEFNLDFYQTVTWILSLPWLQNDPTWLDLKPANAREVAKIADCISQKLGCETVCECLYSLSLLPKEVAFQWRVHIFRQALSDSSSQVKRGALEAFPILLLNLGPNANHLVKDVVHPCVKDEAEKVQEMLVQISGPLACVVSRKAIFTRPDCAKATVPFHRTVTISCVSCDSLIDLDSVGSPRERPELVNPNMFAPFMVLIHSVNTDIKLEFIKSLKRIFGHIRVRKNNSSTIDILNESLVLIEDPVYNVRKQFSKIIPDILGDRESSLSTNQLVLSKLAETFSGAKRDGNMRLQETVLLTIAQLGRVSEGAMLETVIIILLENMLSTLHLVAVTARQELQNIAKHKKAKPEMLFMKSRMAVCKFLVDAMHDAQQNQDMKSAEDILKDVTKGLLFNDVKTFLLETKKYLIPLLIQKGTAAASAIIKMLATQMEYKSRKKLLIDNTKYVFPYLVRFCPKEEELQSSIKYLTKETEFELKALLRLDFQRTHNELLTYLSTNKSRVMKGLEILASCDESYTGPRITTNDEMAAYLQPRILGVLVFFEVKLLSSNVIMEEKQLFLESLISIMELMGTKYITTIRHKIMNTLRICLQFTERELVEISVRAWNCFVRSLEVPLLGQMLAQIVALLLPLMELMPKHVANIINFLIVENREVLKVHFYDIYFLPDLPELSDANTVLKCYTEGPSSQSDLKTRIEHTVKWISHESLDVRLHALSKLKKLLRDEREAYFQYVLGNETADPIISQLVSVVLKGCREPNPRAQNLYAECLGELGAIDPGRLELSANNPKEAMAKFHSSIADANVAVELINEIVKSYLAAAEPTKQDCFALALQELLQIYQISEPSEKAPSGGKLWKRFPEHVQEILVPLVSSRYVLFVEADWSNLQKPIYGSKKGRSFKDWVSNWTGYLSSKVKNEKAFRIFKSCALVIKYDIHIALYILPYCVLYVLLDCSQEDVRELHTEILEVLTQAKRIDTKHRNVSDFQHMSTQTVFSVLDYLTKWKRFTAQMKAAETPLSKAPGYLNDPGYVAISDFLSKIPQDLLAEACFTCQAFTRALMHFEQFVAGKEQNQYLQDHLDFMQKLYVAMDEPDGVLGVAAIRQSAPTLTEQILTHTSLGQQHEMQACYELAIQSEPDEFSHHQGLLQGFLDLGQQNMALQHATGVIGERPNWESEIHPYRVEAAWKLCDWKKLEMFVKSDKESRNWSVGLGKILLSAKDKEEENFLERLKVVRQDQMGPLSAASMETGSYQRGYKYILRLHMLNEVAEAVKVFMNMTSGSEDMETRYIRPHELLAQWEKRLQLSQSSFRIQEPVLELRRTLLTLAQQSGELMLDKEIGHCWLWSAKIATQAGYLQTAYSSLLQASDYNVPEFCLQKAKWLWEKGDNDQALTYLEREMQTHFGDVAQLKLDQSEEGKTRRQVYARALLLYGQYSEEKSSIESTAIMKQYRDVIDICPNWEDGYFHLGKYCDKVMTSILEERDKLTQAEYILRVVKNFGQSLQYGNQYIYQSMPRMLSLWLDFGSTVIDLDKKEKAKPSQSQSFVQALQKMRNILTKLNKMIAEIGKALAPYQLFTAFSQLISRICHAHHDVFEQLKTIMARLVKHYPQQALWMMMSVSKSSYHTRVERCQEIFTAAKAMDPSLHKLIQDATKLSERLLDLCEKEFPNTLTLSVAQHFRPIKRLLEDSKFSPILLPLQSAMTVTLPIEPDTSHNPFPGNQVYINGLEDTIEILQSLQRPKKITLIGSDGHFYVMMCKPKDDLRKDCRLMEFNAIVNKFLRKDPESRKRQLYIRTYTVTPLNEECGLLEWVNNTSGLRNILMKMYKEKGLYTSGRELKSMQPPLHSSLENKLQIYKQKLLVKHPPIFNEWFLRTFPDPTSWYNARLSYSRTAAVMSMVGYILGLGDRHGENILFDSTSGDCVHVDFNCLFNKGETFEWPERVPFRLTHNMVDAMGPMKWEGIFQRACEVTLRVMRNQMDPLMSVLKPFVYDPLVEWSKPAKGQRSTATETGEINNEQAKSRVMDIEARLKGILKSKNKTKGLALSVEGHVNYLIKESTDENNLCQMYIGWAAYL